MSRKITHKSFGQRRRSPRISALDASKEEQEQLARTAKINKRKLDDSSAFTTVSKLAKQVWKGRDNPNDDADDHSTDHCQVELRAGRVRENQKHGAVIPAKHILELVLDTLQRRDTYEIFAQPVDPNEVEDYHKIIEEPMDFGTMRAKLHEGMYETLEQFEHDAFLIPENAMQFNSSATIYYRTARNLHELANKVFHALKTDPENFVSEFSGTRRRSMRKALSSNPNDVPKDSSRLFVDASSKGTPSLVMNHPPSTSTTFRKAIKKDLPAAVHCYAPTKFVPGRGRDGDLCEEAEDKRKAYEELRSSWDNEHQEKETLRLMNEGEVRYKDSLMSYVKDLGPTAQMVAKRKLLLLLGQKQGDESRRLPPSSKDIAANPPSFRTFRDFAPPSGAACSSPFLLLKKAAATDHVIDLTKEDEDDEDRAPQQQQESNARNKDKDCGATTSTRGGKEKMDIRPTPGPAAVTLLTSRSDNRVAKKDGVSTRNSNNNNNNNNVRQVILALEHTPFNAIATEYKPRSKKSSLLMGPPRPPAAADQQRRKQQPLPLPPPPPVPLPLPLPPSLPLPLPLPQSVPQQFTFDLPFLKARLEQMSVPSFEKGGGSKCMRYGESAAAITVVNKPFLYNNNNNKNKKQSNTSLDSNLALQL